MKKSLYKSNDRKLCGVCGGFAEYLNLDPTIVRLAWAIISLFSFGLLGIIIYIVAAMVMPDKPEGDVVVITEDDQNNEK